MSTTIKVNEETREFLDSVMTKENLDSYDKVIYHLAESHVDTISMFGITKRQPLSFAKEDEMQSHEL